MNTRVVKNQVYITKVSNDIIYSISIDNFEELTKLINKNNVNDIIDNKNGYNALHYAVKFNNNKMIDYLLSIGANPYIKTGSNSTFTFITQEDAFDLSLKFQSKHIISYELNENKKKNSEFQRTISSLEKKVLNLDTNNKYLINSVDELVLKNNLLKKDNSTLKIANTNLNKLNISLNENNTKLYKETSDLKKEVIILKDKNSLLKKEYDTLDTNHKSLKRKYDSLDESYSGLLNKNRKQN
jgi:ankyrin repeat protein